MRRCSKLIRAETHKTYRYMNHDTRLVMPRGRIKAKAGPPYRIKDLAEMTGVSREAVRFYINEGLLPPPMKSAHNMGWYSDRHVELLRMIQKLQTEQFLPLKAIRVLLSGKQDLDFSDAQARTFEEMRRRIVAEHRDLTISDDPGKVAAELGLSRREQKELRALGLAADGKATMSDVEIARQWIAIRDAGLSLERGFSPANLAFMKDVVDIALRSELELFSERIETLGNEEAAKVIDIVIPALNRLFALFHERSVAVFVQQLSLQRQLPAESKDVGAARRKPVRKTARGAAKASPKKAFAKKAVISKPVSGKQLKRPRNTASR